MSLGIITYKKAGWKQKHHISKNELAKTKQDIMDGGILQLKWVT